MLRVRWVDAVKGLAIIAVIFDHAVYLYPDLRGYLSAGRLFFSIPWFFFILGYTNSLSLKKRGITGVWDITGFWSRHRRILFYYLIGTIVTTKMFFNEFNLAIILKNLINFSAQPPYYFFNIAFQFYFLFPFLYLAAALIKKRHSRILFAIALLVVTAYLFGIKSPGIFSPAGSVLGGYNFFAFYLGILFPLWELKFPKFILLLIWFLLSESLFRYFGRGYQINRFDIIKLSWAISLLFIAIHLLNINPIKKFISMPLSGLGLYTLPIFIFHYPILVYAKRYLYYIPANFALGIIAAIIIPILAEFVFRFKFKRFSVLNLRKNRL